MSRIGSPIGIVYRGPEGSVCQTQGTRIKDQGLRIKEQGIKE